MPSVSPAIQLGSSQRGPAPLPPGAPFYEHLWRGWKRLGRAVGTFISRVVLTVAYFVAVTPFAIAARLSSDPLSLKPGPARWTPIPPTSVIEDARHGF